MHTKEDVAEITLNKSIEDFEDGLEYYAALREKCQYIITNDVDDFYFSGITVCRPDSFITDHVLRN